MFFVSTLAEDGSPSVGSELSCSPTPSSRTSSTSYTTVKAATATPGPAITVRQGNDDVAAKLLSIDEAKDLALLSIAAWNIKRLPWADGDPVIGIGERVFSVSGLGAGGGAVSQGLVGDVSAAGIQHDAPIGPQFQGAPSTSGEVVGVSSRRLPAVGLRAGRGRFAPLIRDSCEKVLQCP